MVEKEMVHKELSTLKKLKLHEGKHFGKVSKHHQIWFKFDKVRTNFF